MHAPHALEQVGATRRRLLETLLHTTQGLSVEGLTSKLGITATAVRQHLSALEADGLVQFRAQPAERGRPQHLYSLSERGLESFPRRYRELAEAVIGELSEHLGPDALAKAMRRMGQRAAAATGDEPATIAQTAAVMKQLGYEAAPTPGRNDEIVAHNCVFHRLAQQQQAVCHFDLGFMAAATGRQVTHKECMVRGGACCRFRFGRKA